jgi:hypothetical protein
MNSPSRKTVSFNGSVTVAKTFASTYYNRKSIVVAPMLAEDVREFHAFHASLLITISVEQQLFRWKNETDKFMADAFGGGMFSSSTEVVEPMLVSDDSSDSGCSSDSGSESGSQASF